MHFRNFCFTCAMLLAGSCFADARTKNFKEIINKEWNKTRILYGIASYYADKFQGRETANGEVYDHSKMTAACNVLPLGTWIRVTNISNSKSVIVHTNDRLHIRMKRLVDLSRSAAEILGYTRKGLTQVKVEVLLKEQ